MGFLNEISRVVGRSVGVGIAARLGRYRGNSEFYMGRALTDEVREALVAGTNLLAIQCSATEGNQYIDAGFVGTSEPVRD